jgi:hypothetical protein
VDAKLAKWPGLRPHVVDFVKRYPSSEHYEIFRDLYK